MSEQQYHYFAGSCLHWEVGDKIHEIVARLKRKDRNKKAPYQATMYAVFRVPLPLSTNYKVVDYQPDVEGLELVYKENY